MEDLYFAMDISYRQLDYIAIYKGDRKFFIRDYTKLSKNSL